MKASIQQGAFVQPVHPLDDLLAVQPPRDAVIVTAGDLPTHAFRQILAHRFPGVRHGPPSSLACRSASEDSGPAIKAFAYVGISEQRFQVMMMLLSLVPR